MSDERTRTAPRRKVNDESLRPTTLAASIAVPVDQHRKQRQWAHIREQLDEDERTWRWLPSGKILAASGSALIAAAAVLVLLFHAPTEPRPGELASSPTAPSEPKARAAHVMTDGSRAWLDAGSKVAVREDTKERFALALHGGADFDVTKQPSREFLVEAGPVIVRVIGTRFRVEHTAERVAVTVAEGLVEVDHAGQVTPLEAGESWSVRLHDSDGATKAAPPPTVEDGSSAVPAVEARPKAPAALGKLAVDRQEASHLWAQAEAARRNQHYADAARLFSSFAERYPDDPRANLAGFEAARLHQDALNDPQAALRALEGRHGATDTDSLSEHALARRIEALEKLGETEKCQAARADYLQKYPEGTHRSAVAGACQKH